MKELKTGVISTIIAKYNAELIENPREDYRTSVKLPEANFTLGAPLSLYSAFQT